MVTSVSCFDCAFTLVVVFAESYQRVLYGVNSLTLALGLVVVGVTSWETTNLPETFALQLWPVFLQLAFGVIVVFASVLGFIGTRKAPRYLHQRQTNWWLWAYFGILVLSLAMQLTAAGVLLVRRGTLEDARAGPACSH